MILEIARDVLGVRGAHAEYGEPEGAELVITALECSLVGVRESLRLVPGTRARRLYGRARAIEEYLCNHGLNPGYRPRLEAAGLTVSGIGPQGEVRVVELGDHPFFVATLFLPQLRSTASVPHPVLRGFRAAVLGASSDRRVL